jgi:Na+-driven multidrug efflux pump
LGLTTLAAAGPPAFMVAWFDGLNDKPGGSHANAWTYPKVILISALAAGLAALAARAMGRPRTFEARVFRPVLFGGFAVAAVSLTSCFWLSWVFETQIP